MAREKANPTRQSRVSPRRTEEEAPPEVPTDEMVEGIVRITTHPEFVQLVREIEQQPPEQRRSYAEVLATPREFARRGIPMPEGFRVTTRYFEHPGARSTRFDKISDTMVGRPVAPDEEGLTICASIGYIVCVTVGGEV